MKTIKIMIAATEELHDEKLEFTSLIQHLNEVMEPRGITLERVKWNPEEGDIEKFMAQLNECEMCLTLYWNEIANSAEEELDTAYSNLKQGSNPRNLYVFFKEPSTEITEALKDFKAEFVTKYGHFYCRFENVDTMNLHFILQLEAYQNSLNRDFVDVKGGKVVVGGKEMVNLANVPFAAMNKEYQRLSKELCTLEAKLVEARSKLHDNPDDEEAEELFCKIRREKKEIEKEFENYQRYLYAIALDFAKRSADRYSERMALAREQFEKGNTTEADNILDIKIMKKEARMEEEQFEQQRKNLFLKIEEFYLKAQTVMANAELSITTRFETACEAYEEAIRIAKKTDYSPEESANIMFGYAYLLSTFNKMHESLMHYQEALEIRRKLAEKNKEAFLPDVAMTLNNIGLLQDNLGRYEEAEESYKEAWGIFRKLAEKNKEAYLPYVAGTLNNIGMLQSNLGRYEEAEVSYKEALEIRRKLAEKNKEAYLPNVAMTLNNIGALQYNLGRYEEAEESYKEALGIYRKLAEKNKEAFLPYVATSLNNIGVLQRNLGRYEEAEVSYKEALEIYRKLAEKNKEAFLPDVAGTLNNIGIQQRNLGRYEEAEVSCKETLEIRRKLAGKNKDITPVTTSLLIMNGGMQ